MKWMDGGVGRDSVSTLDVVHSNPAEGTNFLQNFENLFFLTEVNDPRSFRKFFLKYDRIFNEYFYKKLSLNHNIKY